MIGKQGTGLNWLGFPIRLDESVPVGDVHFEHPDGRTDKFMIVENEVLPIHLTKLGDSPSWACKNCSNINPTVRMYCEVCGADRVAAPAEGAGKE